MSAIVEFVDEICGIYFRSIVIEKKGEKVHQHVHDHDHATYCGAGAAKLRIDGKVVGEVRAGQAIAVRAGKQHEFEALEDATRLTCVHDVVSAQSIKRKGL